MEFEHIPVLLDECIEGLAIKPDGIYIDGTTGGGGHSEAIAKKLDGGRLIAIDKDAAAIKAAGRRLEGYHGVTLVRADFKDMPSVLDNLGIDKVDGILLDLGVSSHQLDTPERGFSYHNEAPLDMRMSGEGISARDVVNTYSERELARILWDYGEEKFSRRIAGKIVQTRADAPIETTTQLAEIIKSGIPAATRREGGHPARRSFQAIRIEVNGEMDCLRDCLEGMFERLNTGGRFVVITFHSLEDRLVKQSFAGYCSGCECPPDFPICVCGKKPRARLVSRKPITAGNLELEANTRSRSAKLRILERL